MVSKNGIENVITTLFEKAKVKAASIASVTIGTTVWHISTLTNDSVLILLLAFYQCCS